MSSEAIEYNQIERRRRWRPIAVADLAHGIGYGLWYSLHHLLHLYLIIPIGVLILFVILYGLDKLLSDVANIKFPASVLGMLINLVVLCGLNLLSEWAQHPSKPRARVGAAASFVFTNYLRITKPSMNFLLKWINVFFIPSFIVLPLSDPITFIECLKIAGVFVVGGLLLLTVNVYLIVALKWLLLTFNVYKDTKHDIELKDVRRPSDVFTSMNDITTVDISSLRSVHTEPAPVQRENPFTPIDLPEPQQVYMRDGLQHVKSTPAAISLPESLASSVSEEPEPNHLEHLTDDAKRVTIFVTNHIDWVLYLGLFCVSLPFYYISSIHVMLPYHLGLTILAYYVALLIPVRWPQLRKFAHPILISTGEILFVCFIGSLIYHHGKPKGFLDDLRYYKTGKTYLNLFSGRALIDAGETNNNKVNPTAAPQWPGCGDILSSLMDISIVSLSLPMFTHRKDFVRNFWVLMPIILVLVGLTFFCYPLFCHTIGIEPERLIGFIGRSVTLALGTPLISALGGSVSLMAVCTILSGICGVLVGDSIFNLLRVPSDDYLTRGVSLGINCGAIATAHLLNVDPRAASMSSLSFSVFGTVMIIMASIGAVQQLVHGFVGL